MWEEKIICTTAPMTREPPRAAAIVLSLLHHILHISVAAVARRPVRTRIFFPRKFPLANLLPHLSALLLDALQPYQFPHSSHYHTDTRPKPRAPLSPTLRRPGLLRIPTQRIRSQPQRASRQSNSLRPLRLSAPAFTDSHICPRVPADGR